LLRGGVAAGELPAQNVELVAAALVGALGEALVGPLSWAGGPYPDVDPDAFVADLVAFCLRSLTEQTRHCPPPTPPRAADAHRPPDRDPRGPQPGRAARGPQPLRGPRRAARGARPRGRRLGARAPGRRGCLLGGRADALGLRGQRAPARPA